jgi:AraC-like DNA-binding protein
MYNCMRGRQHLKTADPASWDIERLKIDCSEAAPVQEDLFCYDKPERSQFDMHYCLELGVVLEGSIDRHYRSGLQSYSTGEIWLCGMWEPHGWGVGTVPTRVLVFFLYPPVLARTYFREAESFNWMAPFLASPEDRPRVPDSRRAEVLAVIERVLGSQYGSPAVQKTAMHLAVLDLLLVLLDASDTVPMPRRWSGQELESIGQATQLVLETPRLITTQEAAHHCGTNRNALSRLFTEYIGISFAEFSLRFRLSSAAVELKDPQEPLKAIAGRWGFTDPSHFHRCFKRYYGCSPALYREGLQRQTGGRPRARQTAAGQPPAAPGGSRGRFLRTEL